MELNKHVVAMLDFEEQAIAMFAFEELAIPLVDSDYFAHSVA